MLGLVCCPICMSVRTLNAPMLTGLQGFTQSSIFGEGWNITAQGKLFEVGVR